MGQCRKSVFLQASPDPKGLPRHQGNPRGTSPSRAPHNGGIGDAFSSVLVLGTFLPGSLVNAFRSLSRANLTLFACVTGGVDWYEIYWPLYDMFPGFGYFFILYIAFMTVGVLNVIIGIFAESANNSAQKERASLNQSEIQLTGSYLMSLKDTLSANADCADDGFVTELELEACMSRIEVIRCFEDLNIDYTEAVGMLRLLGHESEDGCHKICIDEFIVGLLLLKDDTSKEIVTFWYENKQLLKKLHKFMEFARGHFLYQEKVLERQSSLNSQIWRSIHVLQSQVSGLTGGKL